MLQLYCKPVLRQEEVDAIAATCIRRCPLFRTNVAKEHEQQGVKQILCIVFIVHNQRWTLSMASDELSAHIEEALADLDDRLDRVDARASKWQVWTTALGLQRTIEQSLGEKRQQVSLLGDRTAYITMLSSFVLGSLVYTVQKISCVILIDLGNIDELGMISIALAIAACDQIVEIVEPLAGMPYR